MIAAGGEQLLTLAEAGTVLGVSTMTAWRLVRDGAMPVVDVGRGRPRLRVRRSEVDAYIARREFSVRPRRGRGRVA